MGALTIITWGTRLEACGGTKGKFGIEGFEELVEDEAGKHGGKRVTLREAFLLEKKIGGAIGAGEVTSVGGAIH